MRKRLRPAYTNEELQNVYREPHNHNKFEDHKIRVKKSIELLKEYGTYNSIGWRCNHNKCFGCRQ